MRPPRTWRDTVDTIGFIALVIALFTGLAVVMAHGESIPYGQGCQTTVVIQPDGKRIICTTCPTGSGLSVTVCQ